MDFRSAFTLRAPVRQKANWRNRPLIPSGCPAREDAPSSDLRSAWQTADMIVASSPGIAAAQDPDVHPGQAASAHLAPQEGAACRRAARRLSTTLQGGTEPRVARQLPAPAHPLGAPVVHLSQLLRVCDHAAVRHAPRSLTCHMAGRGEATWTRTLTLVEVSDLARPLNIRRTLLAAVDAFLEGSPTSVAKAQRLIDRCYAARRFVTLDEVVWGGVIMALTDSEYSTHRPTLQHYRSLLREGSPEIHRGYLNFDFRSAFTPEEGIWFGKLNNLLAFFGGFPFPDTAEAHQEYEQRKEEIKQSMLQSPPPKRLEDETIYHLILREASTILINVNLQYALLRSMHLVPQAPYSSFPPQPDKGRDDTPDIGGDLDWVRRALRSIVEQGWLLLMWQVTPTHCHFSLH